MTARILPAVLILIAIGLFFGYVNPKYSEDIAALRERISSYDRALEAAEKFLDKKAQIAAKREKISASDLTKIEAFLPDGVDNVQLILDLNALAERAGLTLSDFDTSENTVSPNGDALSLEGEGLVESLDLSVAATGSYAAFKAFLEGTEWSLRPLDLIDLDVSDSETGVYSYQMKFRIYWLR